MTRSSSGECWLKSVPSACRSSHTARYWTIWSSCSWRCRGSRKPHRNLLVRWKLFSKFFQLGTNFQSADLWPLAIWKWPFFICLEKKSRNIRLTNITCFRFQYFLAVSRGQQWCEATLAPSLIMKLIIPLQMQSLTSCQCSVCSGCFQQHFTIAVRDKHIRDMVCPVCWEPDINDPEHLNSYFSTLDIQVGQHMVSSVEPLTTTDSVSLGEMVMYSYVSSASL